MSSSSWLEWTSRLRAYVGWLNSQLRKEGCRRVNDLRNDLRDGVILSHLVASLGGDTVPGIDPSPRTEAQAKENVDRLFRFLIRKGVSLHSLTPKEVCDGDLKAIMRLVHAVASHYKPDTVLNPPKPSPQRKEETTRIVKKSCKVAPLQKSPSNLEPQKRNSKSEPSSLDGYCRLSESFIEQLLADVRQTKGQLAVLQDTLLNGRLESSLKQENTLIGGERKCLADETYENLQEENMKLKKAVQEKEDEITKLKLSLSSSQTTKNFKYPYIVPARIQRDELNVVAEALGSLRHCFSANDARQHTLDTIDQSLAALLERINALEMASPVPTITSTIIRRSPISEKETTSSLLGVKQADTVLQPIMDANSTKVVYYMDKSLTPFRCTLHKRIGEATLRDFKLLFDRPGQYRYHFKTLDPEFGMVKEEVLHDDDLLPGWDSKIVAWIEEECS